MHTEQLWGPPSLLCSGYQGLFPWGKWPGHEADHSPPSSAEAKQCVELYLHSPIRPHDVVLSLKKTAQRQLYLYLPVSPYRWKHLKDSRYHTFFSELPVSKFFSLC